MSTSPSDFLSVLEEELNRIVLDVHDGPVQNMFAALSLLEQLQQGLKTNTPTAQELLPQIEQVTQLVENSLHEIKFFLGTFRSPTFKDRPLAKVLRSLVIQHEGWTGQTVEFEAQNDLPKQVPLPVKIALYRVLQEALSNGHRHSGTDYQGVKVWLEADMLCMRVYDDGAGFDMQAIHAPHQQDYAAHIGLRGMHDRVALVGGKFDLQSKPGDGTSITVQIPLFSPAASANKPPT